jgi:hypothetical protein
MPSLCAARVDPREPSPGRSKPLDTASTRRRQQRVTGLDSPSTSRFSGPGRSARPTAGPLCVPVAGRREWQCKESLIVVAGRACRAAGTATPVGA